MSGNEEDSVALSEKVCKSLNLWDSQSLITLKASGQEIVVHKHVLTHESKYFKKALQQPFQEAQTGTFDFGDDISATDLGNFVSFMYAAAIFSSEEPTFRLRSSSPWARRATGPHVLKINSLCSLITLWRTADYFQHLSIKNTIKKEFDTRLRAVSYSLDDWDFSYQEEEQQRAWLKEHLEGWDTAYDFATEYFRNSIEDAIKEWCGKAAFSKLMELAPPAMVKRLAVKALFPKVETFEGEDDDWDDDDRDDDDRD